MDKAFPSRVNWENLPSRKTPINETNLNKSDSALRIIDDRVIELDTVKSDKEITDKHVKDFTLDEATGIITITWENGQVRKYDTALEKIATNFDFDPDTDELVLYDASGAELGRVDLSELIIPDNFIDNDNFAWTVETVEVVDPDDPTKKHKYRRVTAKIKNNSITDKQMQPNYLADIKAQASAAEDYMNEAKQYAENAEYEATLAQSYAIGGTNIRANESVDNSKYYKEQSAIQAKNAANSASDAAQSASAGSASEQAASDYADLAEAYAKGTIDGQEVDNTHEAYQNNSKYFAELSANSAYASNQSAISSTEQATISTNKAAEALESANNAHTSEENAGTQASNAETSAQNAANYEAQALADAQYSKSYAVGGTGTREGEDTDNSKYYMQQSALQAQASKASAESSASHDDYAHNYAKQAEKWAVGQSEGVDVPSTDETYQNNAKFYANLADQRASDADSYKQTAIDQANLATLKASEALNSATQARNSADNAGTSADSANTSATQAYNSAETAKENARLAQNASASSSDYADLSKSYAVGTDGEVREGDATDNSKYYSEQSAASASSANAILEQVEQAGQDAVDDIKNALDQDNPSFYIDYDTGLLMYEGGRFVFNIDYATGDLMWGLAV